MSTAAPASGALRSSLVPHLRGATITGGLAALGNLVVWGLSRLTGAELVVPATGGRPDTVIGVGPVVVASLVPMLLGGLVLALLTHRLPRPLRAWRVVVVVATLASLGPIVGSGLDPTAQVWLAPMHLVGGVLAAVVLPRIVGTPTDR